MKPKYSMTDYEYGLFHYRLHYVWHTTSDIIFCKHLMDRLQKHDISVIYFDMEMGKWTGIDPKYIVVLLNHTNSDKL